MSVFALRLSASDLERYAAAYWSRVERGQAERAQVRRGAPVYAAELREQGPGWGRLAWEKLAAKIEAEAGNPVPALPFDAGDEHIKAQARMAAAAMYGRALEGGATIEGVRAACAAGCAEWGIAPPEADVGDHGAIARMFDSDWWLRRLRSTHGRRIEGAAIGRGYVSHMAGCYVSDVNLQRRRDQRARNRKALEAAEVENQYGDVFTLQELAERSNANPRIRRAELMTRIAGFEACARDLGHVADFWTVTCPSRFHAVRFEGGRNPRHDGSTPRDAQAHLVETWAKCRAALARRGVRLYGFRIAEPHHDGCPHWHLLMFMPAESVQGARALVLRYFLEDHDPDEPGAREQRCKFVDIDPARAGAAGYVAKYVAKSIDGFGLESDLLGNPALIAAERVEAWASTWGIRQFQQIGGAPVGVWRELRRLTGGEDLTDAAHAAWKAANAGAGAWSAGWAEYLRLQGGPMVERDALRLRVAYTAAGERWDAVEECPVPQENRYGEPCAPGAWGVRDVLKGAAWSSRRYRWRAPSGERAGLGVAAAKAAKVARGAEGTPAEESARRDAERAHRARLRGSGVASAKRAQPWTRVNNCTGVVGDGSERSGERGRAGGRAGAASLGKDADDLQGTGGRAARSARRGAQGDPARAGGHPGDGRGGEPWPMK